MSGLRLAGVPFGVAAAYTGSHHRHHKPPTGHMFSLGAVRNGGIVGVAVVGRPSGRGHQPDTLEVTRLTTDGSRNVCSFLYAAARVSAFCVPGCRRLITYTRIDESGVSLRAAGFTLVRVVKGRSWDTPSRRRSDKTEIVDRQLWEAVA